MKRHRHIQDTRRRRKPCLEIDQGICLTPTTAGYLVHFDPPLHGDRQLAAFTIGKGAWQLVSGSFEGGDLTVRPSLRISTTRDDKPVELLHGFIRNGRWVPA